MVVSHSPLGFVGVFVCRNSSMIPSFLLSSTRATIEDFFLGPSHFVVQEDRRLLIIDSATRRALFSLVWVLDSISRAVLRDGFSDIPVRDVARGQYHVCDGQYADYAVPFCAARLKYGVKYCFASKVFRPWVVLIQDP